MVSVQTYCVEIIRIYTMCFTYYVELDARKSKLCPAAKIDRLMWDITMYKEIIKDVGKLIYLSSKITKEMGGIRVTSWVELGMYSCPIN